MIEAQPRQTIRETIRSNWRPFLAKTALLGTIAWGTNEYMHPNTVEEMYHESGKDHEGDELTIMTVNVHDWKEDDSDFAESLVGDTNVLQELRGALNQYNPDIVCAQEVAKGEELDTLFNDGYNIIHATTVRYPFIKETGNAVLSSLPLKLVEVERLPNSETNTPRNAILFEVELENNRALAMSATHLGTDKNERRIQSETMMQKFGDYHKGTCGDLNADDKEIKGSPMGALQGIGNLRANFPTHPARNPTKEIDHIMLACGKSSLGAKETFLFGSDHLGVVETFDISAC